MRRAVLALATLALAGCSSTSIGTYAPAPATSSCSSCSSHTVVRAADWPAPDNRLTPGSVVPGCTYPRPASQRDVTAATKALVKAEYHYTGPSGLTHVEYDHRVPFALCGANTAANIWPEPYDGAKRGPYTWNFKDTLERLIAERVRNGKMPLEAAQAIFLGDWRIAWCRYVWPDRSNPGVVC